MAKKISNLKILLTILIASCSIINAQQLFKSTHIRKAYEKETRSLDGNPGVKYWMNKSIYKINVALEPDEHKIIGEEKITYINNSPDTLNKIVIRLYMDLYKSGSRRNIEISPDATTKGVNLTKIVVDGINLSEKSKRVERVGTNLIIHLQSGVEPKATIDLSIGWIYEIPSITKIRTGVYDSSSYCVSLWYPQIAVYDDIDGWDLHTYTGLQEFYNDFNDFEVNITVPKEFVVWATGTQKNIEQTFTREYVEKIRSVSESKNVTNIINEKDRIRGEITISKINTWRFQAEQVPDLAFAVSDTYLWDLKKTIVVENSNKTVLVGAAYKKESKDFYEVAEIASQAIQLMSNNLPGIPFPYENVTIFNSDGDSGMEFPMLINDGSFTNRSRTAGITAHELLHQYLPFYVGTNEKKYAWMDEGWARVLQFDIQEAIEPSFDKKASIVAKYSKVGISEYDVPLMVPSTLFDSYLPYKTHAYTRPAMALLALMDYKGIDKFKEGIAKFVSRWKYSHPIPYDFFYTFNEVYEEDLSWFWNPWFFEFANADLGIKDVILDQNNTIVEIENVGKLPLPVQVKVIYNSGEEKIFKRSAGVWKDARIYKLSVGNKKDIKMIQLGSVEIPDVDASNNAYIVN